MTSTSFALPAALTAGPRLSERFPVLYPVAVRYHQIRRHWRWLTSHTRWAETREAAPLPVRVIKHNSLLLRQLGESEMALQHGKVTNLRLATEPMNGLLIRPGETFSFNRVVGECTRRKGYVDGMRLNFGEASPGVGGGICQLANLLHWVVLHSPLTVVERSAHTFHPFPAHGRGLARGVGVSIAYNYVDLVIRNDTDATFQVLVHVGPTYLHGELRVDAPLPHSYHVEARDEQFLRHEGNYYRRNEIWRTLVDRRTGNTVRDELVKKNLALVKYVPQGVDVVDA